MVSFAILSSYNKGATIQILDQKVSRLRGKVTSSRVASMSKTRNKLESQKESNYYSMD